MKGIDSFVIIVAILFQVQINIDNVKYSTLKYLENT